jgi:hypothetical protein
VLGSSIDFIGIKAWDVELAGEIFYLLSELCDFSRLAEGILEILKLLASAVLLNLLAYPDEVIDEGTNLAHVLLLIATGCDCRGADTYTTWGDG